MEPEAGVEPRFLIIETAHQQGLVALASGRLVVGQRNLEESRRHARDLVPQAKELLAEQGWKPRELSGVIVSRGPGSYTGLRVGLMSAKTLAYATGCALLAVDTFAAIACQAPAEALTVDVIADAQQEKLYVQRFGRKDTGWTALNQLAIRPFADWMTSVGATNWISGPGVEIVEAKLPPDLRRVPRSDRMPSAARLLQLAWERWQRGERDDLFAAEPIYLRPSAAEVKHLASRER